MVNIAVRAARSAGNIMVRYLDRLDSLRVETKGRNDFVSEVDRRAEEEIVRMLRRAYPDHAVVGEEYGSDQGASNDAEYEWIIDPLDGTTNFLHGIPHFAISIGLRYRGRLEAGVIYDPVRQELFTAHRGGGAQLDGRRIRVAQRRDMVGALIGTGFPFRHEQHFPAYLKMFAAVSEKAGDLRRAGSAALDLAYVAAGRLDGYWELGLQPWDMAAGALLVKEAGGIVGDVRGGEEYLRSGHIVCGGPKVFKDLLTSVRPYCTPEILVAHD